jgi:endonuclease/exonuclease/phosphatase family metal-dependent hydrolase
MIPRINGNGSVMRNHRASKTGAIDRRSVAPDTNPSDQRPNSSAPIVRARSAPQITIAAGASVGHLIQLGPAFISHDPPYLMTMHKTPPPRTLRVTSYNIRKTRGLDQRRQPHRTLDVINRIEADIVVLQEADHRLGQRPAAISFDLIASETDFNVAPVSRNDVSLGWHGNAILLRKGLTHGLVRHLDLPGMEPRGAVRLDLSLPLQVSVIAVHLGLLRRSRIQQMEAIAAALPEKGHTIIAGDFNEWSPKRGLEPLEPHFTMFSPGHSFHAARPLAALDRIGLSRGLTLHDAGVRQDALARRASDHLPIWADIEIGDAAFPVTG